MQIPQRGEDDHLTRDEEAFIKRYLSRPESLPQEFYKAILQKIAVDGEPIPFSQVQGFRRYSDAVEQAQEDIVANQVAASVARIATQQAVPTPDSSIYQDLATPGPTLTGLAAGTYLIFVSCNAAVSTTGYTAFMSPSINGATALDANAAISTSTTMAGALNIFTTSLAAGSSLAAKYRSLNGVIQPTFSNRVLVAMRIGA